METTASIKVDFVIPLQPHLLSRARHLTGNDADAKDLVQDTIERALRTSKAPTDGSEIRPWLVRVLTHLWIDRVRAMKVRRCVPFCEEKMSDVRFDDKPDSDSAHAWRDMSLSDVTSALSEVPEPYRRAFQGHALDRRSYAELAREMGIRPVTVGTRVLRARQHLRRILETRMADQLLGVQC